MRQYKWEVSPNLYYIFLAESLYTAKMLLRERVEDKKLRKILLSKKPIISQVPSGYLIYGNMAREL